MCMRLCIELMKNFNALRYEGGDLLKVKHKFIEEKI